MQRRILDPEEQKLVNRWRLVVIGFYATIALITVAVAAMNSSTNSRTIEAQWKSPNAAVSANVK